MPGEILEARVRVGNKHRCFGAYTRGEGEDDNDGDGGDNDEAKNSL